MTARIQLSNQVFTIGISEEDTARREAFFSANVGELTADEKNVLHALGMRVGDAMYDSLRPYLSKFFNALPACQTDTEVYLKQDCEVPYYVLWSILFGNYQETERRLLEQQKRAELPTNLSLAQSAFAAKQLGLPPTAPAVASTPAPAAATRVSVPEDLNAQYLRVIQTLMLTHPLDVPTETSIRNLFTLHLQTADSAKTVLAE